MTRRRRHRNKRDKDVVTENLPEPFTMELEDIAFEGASIGHAPDGRVVFADYGIPGEIVTVAIERQRRDFYEGRVIEVHEPHPARITPPCPYFGSCGGCQWQHIDYPHQLELKQQIVADQLRRLGGFENQPVSPTVPSERPFGYRNNARFSTRKENGYLGFISRGPGGRQFIKIDECMIMHPAINETLAKLQGHGAGLHQVVIRYGENTGDMLVQPDLSELQTEIASGQTTYTDKLLDHQFQISGSSFFQTNTKQAEELIKLVIERLELSGDELIVDAYAGVGTFAALLAPHVRRVIAIEEAPSALKDSDVALAGLENVDYLLGKVEHILGEIDEVPDAVIIDPPRAGCHKRTLDALLEYRPRQIVYVSCNPSTLARDLRILVDGGYEIGDVTPVDMFPQTAHIESVTTLRLT